MDAEGQGERGKKEGKKEEREMRRKEKTDEEESAQSLWRFVFEVFQGGHAALLELCRKEMSALYVPQRHSKVSLKFLVKSLMKRKNLQVLR